MIKKQKKWTIGISLFIFNNENKKIAKKRFTFFFSDCIIKRTHVDI